VSSVERAVSIALGAGVVIFAGYVAVESAPTLKERGPDGGIADAAADQRAPLLLVDASPPPPETDKADAAMLSLTELKAQMAEAGAAVGNARSVRFGVVLVQFAGAQGAAAGARSKADAARIAQELAEGAKTDFRAAVKRGDPGSTDDAGRISRGVLEAESEAVLFALPVGDVGGPMETPRGYWIVKRLE
jgi:hypothetical protein